MGMFDTVNVRCPECESVTEIQTKSGPCTLRTYDFKDAPASVVADLDGRSVTCDCSLEYVMRVHSVNTLELVGGEHRRLLVEFLEDLAYRLHGCAVPDCKGCQRREAFLARVRKAVGQ